MVAFVAFAIVFVAVFILAKNQNKSRAEKIAIDSKDASSLGMKMDADVQKLGRYATATNENYSGTTGAIEWSLQSREIYDQRHRQGSSWRYTAEWKSSSVKFPKDKFLLLMSTPGHDNSKHQLQKKGFLSSITNVLAEGAIDLYVSGYFGPQYTSMVNIDGGVKIDIPELKEFFILTNEELLSKKFLSEITVKYIANWMINKPHFASNSRVNHLGVLFAPDCVIVSCQAAMANAEEAKVFSDFGAGLATLMREVI